MMTEGNLLMMHAHLPLIHITQPRLQNSLLLTQEPWGPRAGILHSSAELQFPLTIGFKFKGSAHFSGVHYWPRLETWRICYRDWAEIISTKWNKIQPYFITIKIKWRCGNPLKRNTKYFSSPFPYSLKRCASCCLLSCLGSLAWSVGPYTPCIPRLLKGNVWNLAFMEEA